MIGIGVVGYGYWGPNIVRNFYETPGVDVVMVSDLRQERLNGLKLRYPTVSVTSDFRELIRNPKVDAVVIATPVSTHFDLAMEAIHAGKHVLVEKPLTANVVEAEKLIEAAASKKRVLMVDHTFVYTGAVKKMRQLVSEKSLGEIYYYDSVRVNLGLFQTDVNVLWDLAVHDLSIMDYVLGADPYSVSATGVCHVAGRPENIAYINLLFPNNLIAHFHVNWLAPVKVRRTLVGGSQKMIVYDDMETSEKIKIYDKGVTVSNDSESIYKMIMGYRTGDMWSPRLDTAEALRVESEHFIKCIEGKEIPITNGESGLRVVRILEAASKSMASKGQPVEIR